MDWSVFKHEVRLRLADKRYLEPVFDDVFDVARYIREVDETLFICLNRRRGHFEVHSLEHRPNTYAWTIPWRRLDGRVVRLAKKNNLMARGDAIFEEMDRHNEKLRDSKHRHFMNEVEAAAIDSRSLFKPLAWEL